MIPALRRAGSEPMNAAARRIQRIYLTLTLGNTLAASFIWGVNTLFLLDAGLSNFEAFAANAFFTVGMVIFEIPTGVVADGWGRRVSFLLGTVTLAGSTFLYYLLWQFSAPFPLWAVVSVLLGLGFTFFSGAVEAWLVDALRYSGYEGGLEAVFGRGQMVAGAAMLAGSASGGAIAQATNLGVPFLVRAGVLLAMFAVAMWLMHDVGFTPARSTHPLGATRAVLSASIDNGLKIRPVRYVMLAAPFSAGVGIYVFYALQPYLLELFGDPQCLLGGRARCGNCGGRAGHWRLACALRPKPVPQTDVGTDRQRLYQYVDFSGAGVYPGVLGGPGPAGGLGHRRLLGKAGAAGVHQRHDSFEGAGHGPQLRLADGIERGRGGSAAARPERRLVRLCRILGYCGGYPASGGAVPAGQPAAGLPGR
ncbi:MFS family permease [Pseudarthrobacter siccitolerans]|uniref:MFS family permease n=1 Tax=Pseudarthrobacter siccitolerans TaxID=861266 RepID=A0ABU0PFB6_9MICC|nr:MFS family permease [Pseudarthrobacter siccitolerans]